MCALSDFQGPIARWLIDILNLKLNDINIKSKLESEIKNTWFCGITDSCQIAKFYHRNNIEGVDLRSDWRTVAAMADGANWVSNYMMSEGLTRIVLLEDFVGSGTQIDRAVNFAATLTSSPEILICPLVICPSGAENGRRFELAFPNVSFSPVLELSTSMFLSAVPGNNEPDIYNTFRQTISRLHHLVAGTSWTQDYGPFGFRGTGGLTIMYTNCPDNTLPIIHHESDGPWKALFPRSSRLET